MFEVVDGAIGIGRRRPRQARAGFLRRVGRQHAVVRDRPGDRPHDVERIEGRDPRARFRHVEARVREVQALRRGANRNLEEKAFGRRAIVLAREPGVRKPVARRVEEQRILARPLRNDPLGEAGHEDHPERSAPRLERRPHEQPSVAAKRRLPVERDETIVQDIARFLDRHRPDAGHRPQLRQCLQHPRGTAQHASGQFSEAIDPLAPHRLIGPVGKRVDDRQRELAQVREVPQVALEARNACRLGLLAFQLGDPISEVGRQPIEPAPPPPLAVRAAASPDDRRFDDQFLPFPWRSQRAGHHRFVV